MAAATISLKFDGYWREQKISGIPAQSGIYCVYVCAHDPNANTVALKKLVYTGESEYVHERIQGHEKWKEWRRHVGAGQELCFTFAPITTNRDRAQAAMIHHHKPSENTEYKNDFPFDTTTMNLDEKTALLDAQFTVYRTAGVAASRW